MIQPPALVVLFLTYLFEKIDNLTFYDGVLVPVSDGLSYLLSRDGAAMLSVLADEGHNGHAGFLGLLLALGVDIECDRISFHSLLIDWRESFCILFYIVGHLRQIKTRQTTTRQLLYKSIDA